MASSMGLPILVLPAAWVVCGISMYGLQHVWPTAWVRSLQHGSMTDIAWPMEQHLSAQLCRIELRLCHGAVVNRSDRALWCAPIQQRIHSCACCVDLDPHILDITCRGPHSLDRRCRCHRRCCCRRCRQHAHTALRLCHPPTCAHMR